MDAIVQCLSVGSKACHTSLLMFLLQYGHGCDPMYIRDKGKRTALCLMARQAQNIQDFAHSLSSGLIVGEINAAPLHLHMECSWDCAKHQEALTHQELEFLHL